MAPPLGELHIDVTGQCNLACGYCYFYAGEERHKGGPPPSTEAIEALIDEAEALGCGEITLTGGEPLLRDDIPRLLAHGESLKTLLTNGMLLSPARVAQLEAIEQLKEIKVSLDGFEGHDRQRGAGSSAQIRRNLEVLDRSSSIPYVINTILGAHNVDDLQRLYDWVKDSSCYRWAIDVAAPTGRAAGGAGALPYDAHTFAALEALLRRFLADGAPFKLHVMNVFHSELLEPGVEDDFGWSGPAAHPCDYYRGGYTVRIDGTVAFCPSLPLVFGRLGEGRSLAEILASPAVEDFDGLRVSDVPGCRGCRYLAICGSGCRADALLRDGSMDAVDVSACQRMGFFEDRVLPLIPAAARARLAARIDPAGRRPL